MTVQELKQTHQGAIPIGRADLGGARIELKHRTTCYPLGFPLEIASNSERVLDAARETWAGYKPLFKAWPMQVRIAANESEDRHCPPQPKCRLEHHLVTNVADSDNYIVHDISQGFSFGAVSS